MQLVVTLADTRSVTATAELLGVTPSAVSQATRKLENRIGFPITTRAGRNVQVSDQAVQLAERMRPLLGQLIELETDLERRSSIGQGRVRIGAFPSACRAFVPTLIQRALAADPALTLSVVEAEPDRSLAMLDSGAIDLAVIHRYDFDRPYPQRRTERHLLTDHFRCVDGTASKTVIDIGELATKTWLLPSETTNCGIAVRRFLETNNIQPRVAAVSADFETLAHLAMSGLGVTLLPASCCPPNVPTRKLKNTIAREVALTCLAHRRHEQAIRHFFNSHEVARGNQRSP